jgi:hypothetical protein
MAKHDSGKAAENRVEKKSKFDQNRTAFVDSKTGDYVFNEWVNQGTEKNPRWILREVARIPAEMGKWVKLLDEDDAAVDLQNRYEDEHRDYSVENRKQANQELEEGDSSAEDGQTGNPMEVIPDKHGEPEKVLFPEEEATDPRIEQIEQTKVTRLTEEQRNLYYDHVGQQMYLEDIRREKISVTGKNITQQAVSKQWRKTMKIFCDDLGVEMPKTRGKRKKDE